MDRSELAKELREFLPRLFVYSEDDYMADLKALIGQAATALEDEDKDARRYRVLLKALRPEEYCYHITLWSDGLPCLMADLILYRKQKEMWPEGKWYPTMDAALDAWLEKEGKDG